MRRAKITNLMTGVAVECHATTEHPDSSYGQAVWVDNDNQAYLLVDLKTPNPYYIVEEYSPERCAVIDIGERIAKLRKEKGMTQADLAESAGIKQASLARIEAGKHAQRLDILSRIAAALGKTIDLV